MVIVVFDVPGEYSGISDVQFAAVGAEVNDPGTAALLHVVFVVVGGKKKGANEVKSFKLMFNGKYTLL